MTEPDWLGRGLEHIWLPYSQMITGPRARAANRTYGSRIVLADGLAVEMVSQFDIDALRAWFVDQGVFIRPLGRVIYLAPADTINEDDLGRLTNAVRKAVGTLLV